MFNKEKFKTVVHQICHTAKTEDLGSTKLNKILWYSDSLSYLKTGESLTGETYRKQKFVWFFQHILPILSELEFLGCVVRDSSDYHGYSKTNYHCQEEPNRDPLEEGELNLINKLTDFICKKHTATSISKLSHDRIWELAEPGEEIPLYATFASNITEPNETTMKWALSTIGKR